MLADRDFANSAIVQHPSNPMITSILQCTAHVRPTDDGRPTIFQFPPLLPGLAPATPAVTTHTKKQSKKERTSVSKLKQQKDRIKVKIPFEDAVKVLEMREATIVAKMRDGVPLDGATAFADLMTIGHCKQYLAEKARLESVGGSVADMLAERQKKMAEQDGAPDWLLP